MRTPGHRSRRTIETEHLSTRDRDGRADLRGLREEDEDCLSALPDDVLRLVLRRLDTRSALATAALSRRWARLRIDLPALEFKVGDVLPKRYRQHLRRRLRAGDCPRARDKFVIDRIKKLDLVLSRYERHGMRSLADSLEAFLHAHADAERPRRRVRKVSLEIFPTHNTGSLDRLITTAVGAWGAEDLEVVVLKSHRRQSMSATSYSFPHRSFDILLPEGTGEVRLKRLKLSNCAPHVLGQDANPSLPPARAFSALAVLVLQDLPRRTRGLVYGSVIRACPVLEVLHLRSCGCRGRSFTIDAPDSRLVEMIVELNGLILGKIDLRALPRLERLACMGAPMELKLGVVPRLAHLNLTYDEDASRWTPRFQWMGIRNVYLLSSFLASLAGLEDLVLRFTGPEMWLRQPLDDMPPPLGKLRKLLVADMPSSWDITWTCYILESAPFLETLHIHVAAAADDDVGSVAAEPICWPPSSEFRHKRLGEVVIGGFEGTPKQVHFVRFLRGTCTALRDVMLLRHGIVRDKDLWDWEKMAPRQEWQWSEEDRGAVLRGIEDAETDVMSCSSAHIVFRNRMVKLDAST